ncbi:ArsA family ATPase [Caldilinea sp.]|jgi:arsenite-transporting ATPase|nr:ArsA family ATPase [Caldilinea sp.]GIV68376.1 MAG: arsenic-transporting ATPase [Caldilinea sp.]
MRIILYLGKGGVGKTTTAAASAIRCADLGYRTLVVSTDIAHSLADSLDVPLRAQPVEVAPNLYAQEINVVEEVREHWGEMQGYVGNILRRQGMSKAVAEEMAIIPGMEEVVSLLHINKQANEGRFDCVIVDAAPTGETMRLLTMPESFQWYVARLRSWGDAPIRIAAGLLNRLAPEKDLVSGLNSLVEGVRELQKVLTNPDITSYRIVLNPEKMVIKEGARAVTYLSLFGYPVDAAIVNRILPGVQSDGFGKAWVAEPSADPYLHHLQEIQARYLGEIERDFYPLPILRSRWYDEEMVGLERLRQLADDLFEGRDPSQLFFRGQAQSIEEEGEDLVLRLPLPQLELEKVRLTKRGDELFINIGNFKREMLLPSVLAQREASSAVFANGVLKIRFPPSKGDGKGEKV